MKYILVITLILLLVSCTKNRKTENISPIGRNDALYVVDIDSVTKENIVNLSSYFKSVRTIILETNEDCLIGIVSNIRVVDNFIIITDSKRTESVFVFDKNGRFIHKIGKMGQGPGEYVDIVDSSIDFDKKEIYLFDFTSNKINRYDIASGRFINSINIGRDDFKSYYVQYINNKMYTSATPFLEMGDSFLLQEINIKTGEHVNSYLRASEYNNGWNSFFVREEGFFYPDNAGNSKYIQMFMDTIVCLGKDGIKPFLTVKAKNWITPNDIHDLIEYKDKNNGQISQLLFERNISYNIHRYFETENLIYFQYYNNRHIESVIYNKDTDTVRVANLFIDDMLYYGDKMISPLFAFSDSKGVYSYLTPEKMPRFLEIAYSDGLNPNIDKLDDIKKVSEDSNPILFYYECK